MAEAAVRSKAMVMLLLTCCLLLLPFVYARRRYVAMANMRHGLVACNTHNFVVCGQKHKVWVLVLLVRTSETL